jgi:hypothetical protein
VHQSTSKAFRPLATRAEFQPRQRLTDLVYPRRIYSIHSYIHLFALKYRPSALLPVAHAESSLPACLLGIGNSLRRRNGGHHYYYYHHRCQNFLYLADMLKGRPRHSLRKENGMSLEKSSGGGGKSGAFVPCVCVWKRGR